MDEAINFKITAQNDAIPSFKKTSAELQNVQVNIKAVGEQTAKSSDAIQKFANVIGAGWLGDAASGMKELSEAAGQSSVSLKGGGASALAMKAGLVGLVAYGSFSVGKMISDWVWQTKAAKDEMESLKNVFREQSDSTIAAEAKKADLRKRNFELFSEGAAKEEAARKNEIELAKEIANREFSLNQIRGKGNEAYEQVTKKIIDDKKKELEFYKSFNSEEEKLYRQRLGAIEQEKIRDSERVSAVLKQEEERKRAIEARIKFEQQEQEKLFKMREQAAKKQQDAEIKMAGESVKSLEKQISELDKMKTSSTAGMSLSSADERMTSLARGSGNIEQQQLEQAKKQTQLMELNKKLMEELARLAKLQADKEEKVFELAGA